MRDPLAAGDRHLLDTMRFSVHQADGAWRGRSWCLCADAVVMLPFDVSGRVLLIRNERLAAGTTLWEVPAGTLEAGEAPEACALREIEEETGHRAGTLSAIGGSFPCPGMVSEYLHGFVAHGCTPLARGQSLDEVEHITVHPTPWHEVLEMARDGRIRDTKSLWLVLWWQVFGGGGGGMAGWRGKEDGVYTQRV